MHILVVESCLERQALLVGHLQAAGEGYDITATEDIDQAVLCVAATHPELVVLGCEVKAPGDDAFEPCRVLRRLDPGRASGVLVIASGLLAGQECAAGQAGADACLRAESFRRLELHAVVQAILAQVAQRRDQTLVTGPLTLIHDRTLLRVGSSEIRLTRLEFLILWTLAKAPGQFFSVEALMEVCEDHAAGAVYSSIKRLRQKLGPARDLVRTAWGRGYYLDLESVILT